MTFEEIERTLQATDERHSKQIAEIDGRLKQTAAMQAEHQARHSANMAKLEEMQAQHTVDIAEIDKLIETLVQSQNRYDTLLSRHDDILHYLADVQLKNEERFAELAAERVRHQQRMAQLEASYELFEGFVKDFRNETNERFVGTNGHFDQITAHSGRRAGSD